MIFDNHKEFVLEWNLLCGILPDYQRVNSFHFIFSNGVLYRIYRRATYGIRLLFGLTLAFTRFPFESTLDRRLHLKMR